MEVDLSRQRQSRGGVRISRSLWHEKGRKHGPHLRHPAKVKAAPGYAQYADRCQADMLPAETIPPHYGLGHVLRYWRHDVARIGLLRLERMMHVTHHTIEGWERNERPISHVHLEQFAGIVGCLSVTQMLSAGVSGAETTGRGEAPYPRHNTRRMPK